MPEDGFSIVKTGLFRLLRVAAAAAPADLHLQQVSINDLLQ
jgi:hypothetical protein